MLKGSQAQKQFVEDLKKKDRSPSTIVAYGKDIEQLVDFVKETRGKENVEDIETEDIQGFLKSLAAQDYAKKSISRKLNSIKTFFGFLQEKGVVQESPADPIPHPKIEPKPPRILSQLEYRALRDAVRDDKRMAAVVEVLLQTGIRIGELRQIRIQDINFAEEGKFGTLYIRPSHRQKGREIPLSPSAQEAIREYLKVRPESEENILFITSTGNPFLIRNIRASMNRYFEKAGIKDATLRDLRHTFIAHQLRAGVDITQISKIVGHKRLTSTERYLQYVKTPEEEAKNLKEL